MFENLSQRLTRSLRNVMGQGRLTEDNIKDTLREVRLSLLEADVALPVVKDFIAEVKSKALGIEVSQALDPGQEFIKIVFNELKEVMGSESAGLNLAAQPPAVILMAGLQGAGKTTSAAKLAKYLIERMKKSVMTVSADVYRPAAIDQLETLSRDVGAEFYPSKATDNPLDIVAGALDAARKRFADVLIVDTAGRLHNKKNLMDELSKMRRVIDREYPEADTRCILVLDATTGQNGLMQARAFKEVAEIGGIILSKLDGTAKGGIALAIRQELEVPVWYIGVGEGIDDLQPFNAKDFVEALF